MCFFDILFTEIQVIFINFPIPYFISKKKRAQPTAYQFKSQINIMGYHNTIQYFQPETGAIILPYCLNNTTLIILLLNYHLKL